MKRVGILCLGKILVTLYILCCYYPISPSPPNVTDVLIVGSGYGGSVIGMRLSAIGLHVTMMERGPWQGDIPRTLIGQAQNIFIQTASLDLDGSLRHSLSKLKSSMAVSDGLPGVNIGNSSSALHMMVGFQQSASTSDLQLHQAFVGVGVGGGSLINSGILIEPPIGLRTAVGFPPLWQSHWDRSFSLMKSVLQHQPLNSHSPLASEFYSTMRPSDMAANFTSTTDLNNCTQQYPCNECFSICNKAKYSLDKNYLKMAMENGMDLLVEHEVEGVINMGGGEYPWGVQLKGGGIWQSKYVFISAGVFGSARVLMGSPFLNKGNLTLSPQLGKRISGNGDELMLALQGSVLPFSEMKDYGPVITAGYIANGSYIGTNWTSPWVLVENMVPPSALQGVTPLSGAKNLSQMIDMLLEYIADPLPPFKYVKPYRAILMMALDNNDGEVQWDPQTGHLLSYQGASQSSAMKNLKDSQLSHMAEDWGSDDFTPSTLAATMTVHPLGGCAYGPSFNEGVVNEYGQVYSGVNSTSVYDGLYVVDGSILPGAIGLNPLATIATVAETIAEHFIRNLRKPTKKRKFAF